MNKLLLVADVFFLLSIAHTTAGLWRLVFLYFFLCFYFRFQLLRNYCVVIRFIEIVRELHFFSLNNGKNDLD